RVTRLPTAEEALDRRVENQAVEVRDREEPVTTHSGVLRGDGLERASSEVAREDDVHDVLLREAARRRDRVDEGDGSLHWQLVVDPDLLRQLAVQRVDEALSGVDAAAGQEPVLLACLLVPAQEHASLPAQDRRDADAWLESHQVADDPNPRTP